MRSRAELAASLRERYEEIEKAIAARARAIADPREDGDTEYVIGLREAIGVGVAYWIDALERGEGREEPIPIALLSQARLAARNRVPLDTVLRRCFAAHALFDDFLLEEAERCRMRRGELHSALRVQARLLDRLLVAVREEYGREQIAPRSAEERKVEVVKRLLLGEAKDTALLSYDLEATHVGLIARGPGAAEVVRELAASLEARLLLVEVESEIVWAWLGEQAFGQSLHESVGALQLPSYLILAYGEPAEGLHGWRLTHRQASAAMAVALQHSGSAVRYADVILLAAAFGDDLLADSLRRLYLDPLAEARDGGRIALHTLKAYFLAGHHFSAAASSLGVDRKTVKNRLQAIEEKLGRPLNFCAAELMVALQLESSSIR